MAVTVSMLEAAGQASTSVRYAVQYVSDAATQVETGRDLVETVSGPLGTGDGWGGAGQPASHAVVSANATSMQAAALRLRDVEGHLGAFKAAMTQAVTWWLAMEATLDETKYAVADDGTVTRLPDADLADDDPDPSQLTSEVKQILSYLDAADATLAAELTTAVTDPMPVTSADASPTLGIQAQQALTAAQGPMGPYAPNPWDKSWDPTENVGKGSATDWDLAVLLGAPCLPSAYTGGGFLVGPDGRTYPIVTVDPDDQTAAALDTGWQTLGTYTDYQQLEDPLSTADNILIAIGAAAGASYAPYATVNPSATKELANDLQAPVEETSSANPGLPSSVPESSYTYVVTDGKGKPQVETYTPPSSTIGAGLEVATNVVDAGSALAQADANTHYTYQVEFQQNTDGRVRAVYTAYQVIDGPDGQYVQTYDVSLGENGDPVLEPRPN